MFNKNTSSQIRSKFWITFGRLMSPIPNSNGESTNWINYNTSVKDIEFKMDVIQKQGHISINLTHKDPDIRLLFFEQFEEFKFLLGTELGEDWIWEKEHITDSGKSIARIYTVLNDKTIFNEDHWSDLFSFFKTRIMALDRFWSDAQDIFKDLGT